MILIGTFLGIFPSWSRTTFNEIYIPFVKRRGVISYSNPLPCWYCVFIKPALRDMFVKNLRFSQLDYITS
jgi:hypothetical protein